MLVNIFFPLFSGIDQAIAEILPLWLRVWIWGILAGGATILLYAFLSQQKAIAWLKARSRELRKEMIRSDISGQEFRGLVKENLRVSLTLLLRVFVPGLVSALPVLVVAFCVMISSGYSLPAEDDPLVLEIQSTEQPLRVQPSDLVLRNAEGKAWLKPEAKGQRITLRLQDERIYTGRIFEYALPAIEKRKWWHAMLGSPIGYLMPRAAVDQVLIGVAPARVVPEVPSWLARWEWVYFLGVFLGACITKWRFRIA